MRTAHAMGDTAALLVFIMFWMIAQLRARLGSDANDVRMAPA